MEKVNDFKWLKAQHSPNWGILDRDLWEAKARTDEVKLLDDPRADVCEEEEMAFKSTIALLVAYYTIMVWK